MSIPTTKALITRLRKAKQPSPADVLQLIKRFEKIEATSASRLKTLKMLEARVDSRERKIRRLQEAANPAKPADSAKGPREYVVPELTAAAKKLVRHVDRRYGRTAGRDEIGEVYEEDMNYIDHARANCNGHL